MKIRYDVTYDDVVELILDQKIGAIHQGRSEIGPRALGNRSIVFDPRLKNGKDIVNTVKNRGGIVTLDSSYQIKDYEKLIIVLSLGGFTKKDLIS